MIGTAHATTDNTSGRKFVLFVGVLAMTASLRASGREPHGNENGDTMLREAKRFQDFKIRAQDGDISKARDFLFDDDHSTVRYLVADNGGWLMGRDVLVSPYALEPANERKYFR